MAEVTLNKLIPADQTLKSVIHSWDPSTVSVWGWGVDSKLIWSTELDLTDIHAEINI